MYATSRIDQFLLEYYGPELYDRYTNTYDPYMPKLTATTENVYYQNYGYRSLYGYKILGWLETAHLAYGAAKEVLERPECQKRLICELKSTPKEDLSWSSLKLLPLVNYFFVDNSSSENNNNNDEITFELGHKEICWKNYKGCDNLVQFESL